MISVQLVHQESKDTEPAQSERSKASETVSALRASIHMADVMDQVNAYLRPLLERSAPLRAIPAPFPIWGVQDVMVWVEEGRRAEPALVAEAEIANVVLVLESAALRLHRLSREL